MTGFRFIQNNTDDEPDENEELAEEYASLTVSSFKVGVFVFVVLKVKSFPVDVFDMKSNNVWPGELIYLKVLSSKFMKHHKVARNKILDKNPPQKNGKNGLCTAVRSQSSVDNSVT